MREGFGKGGNVHFLMGVLTHLQRATSAKDLKPQSVSSRMRKRHYNQCIIEFEHPSFSSLMFTPYGGSRSEGECFLVELAHKVSEMK